MEIVRILISINNAVSEQDKANLVNDYYAQSLSLLGEIKAQSLHNQAIIYSYKNASDTELSTGDRLIMQAEYERAVASFESLKLEQLKAVDLSSYLKGLKLNLPKPKNFVEQALLGLDFKGDSNDIEPKRIFKTASHDKRIE